MHKAGDRLTVIEPIFEVGDREVIALPGDRIWVVEARGGRMRVRCPETGFDTWVDTDDGRYTKWD